VRMLCLLEEKLMKCMGIQEHIDEWTDK
jgi:hypothetical protein